MGMKKDLAPAKKALLEAWNDEGKMDLKTVRGKILIALGALPNASSKYEKKKKVIIQELKTALAALIKLKAAVQTEKRYDAFDLTEEVKKAVDKTKRVPLD